MARFRLSGPAKADIRQILAVSQARWGAETRVRYAALLTSALRRVAGDPKNPVSADRADLLPALRSFHLRHGRSANPSLPVRHPVHVVFYRILSPGMVEIVRVLHERADPSRHVGNERGR